MTTIPTQLSTTHLPSLIPLPRSYPPTRVMADPTSLRTKVVDYFSLLTEDPERPKHPTPPGLAMALGLRSFDTLLRIMQQAEDDPTIYPEESLDVLHVARSYIEDYYIANGLREALPQQFVKFLLSAYFNRSERTIQETLNAKDNQLQINILGIGSPLIANTPNTPQEALGCPTIDVQPTTHSEAYTIVYDAVEDLVDDLEDL